MGIDTTVGMAFAKSQLAAGDRMPTSGTVFFSLADRDKEVGARAAASVRRARLLDRGDLRHRGTPGGRRGAGEPGGRQADRGAAALRTDEPGGVDAVALIAAGKVDLVVNSPRGRGPRADGAYIRSTAATHQVPLLTTAAAALAAANGIADWISTDLSVRSLQEYHDGVRTLSRRRMTRSVARCAARTRAPARHSTCRSGWARWRCARR